MPHCASGNSEVTAAASRCAVLWRYSASAPGVLGVTTVSAASLSSGYDRSTMRSSTYAASASRASRGEIPAATSRTGVPAGTRRVDPSGVLTVT